MSDHIAALEAALHTEAMNLPLEVLFGVLAEVKELREELAAAEARADLHAELGRRTAEALGLTDEEGRAHMPEVALALRKDAEALRLAVAEEMDVFIRAGRWTEAVRPMGKPVKVEHGLDALHATRAAINAAARNMARAIEAAEKAGEERT